MSNGQTGDHDMQAQVFRNTERIDTHSVQIADLAARMRISEQQAQNLWDKLAEMDAHGQSRHGEVMDSINKHQRDVLTAMHVQKEELKDEINANKIASVVLDTRGKTIVAVMSGVAVGSAALWGLWKLGVAVFSQFSGVNG